MSLCSQCSARKAKRFCPVLEDWICSLCCVERRRLDRAECLEDCPFNAKAREMARRRVQAVTRRHGGWLARRLKAFGSNEDLFSAGMDLEEALCAYSLHKELLADQDALEALGFLSAVSGEVEAVMSPPNGLARWLKESLRRGPAGPLASLEKLPGRTRKELLEKLLEIARGETRMGGYLKGLEAYFRDFRKAEGKDDSWFRKKLGSGREEAGGLILG
ncbi:MAG TPA: hypothetical protein ENJ97_01520 [Planctomycetes bacterium]|nr:hypothetical protein [Planctomycetota bacterium]